MNKVGSVYFSRLSAVIDQKFDYVVIGAGAYGTAFAHRMLELDPACRILVFDKGGYLIPDHIQNLPPTYVDLNLTTGIRPWKSTGDMDFMPQIPFVGGRALFWNAWIPQPTRWEMPEWPEEVVRDLDQDWYPTGQYAGRRFELNVPGNEEQFLNEQTGEVLFAGLSKISTAGSIERPTDMGSSMAVSSGVVRTEFAKFAPIPVLVQDLQSNSKRFNVVSDCAVTRIMVSGGEATQLETVQGKIALQGARVILALNTLEAAALVIASLPSTKLAGKNLCGHFRSWLALRVRRSAIAKLPGRFETCAYYVPGYDASLDRFLHTHVTAAYNPHPKRDLSLLYRLLPDASTPQAVAAYQDPEYVVYMLHSMGEFLGERSATSWNYVGVKGGETIVNVKFQPEDLEFWKTMDRTTWEIADVLANGNPAEYQQADGSWSQKRPSNIRNTGLVHEAGTLWMGDSPDTSVCTEQGRLHAVANVYGTGGMLFPRPGSWNPTFTGMAMAFGMARRFAAKKSTRRVHGPGGKK
jgi:hypothetical protein